LFITFRKKDTEESGYFGNGGHFLHIKRIAQGQYEDNQAENS
jgi:hypothetical protein